MQGVGARARARDRGRGAVRAPRPACKEGEGGKLGGDACEREEGGDGACAAARLQGGFEGRTRE